MLIDADYRRTLLKQVTDPMVLSFWHDEFEAWSQSFALLPLRHCKTKSAHSSATPLPATSWGQVQNRLDIRALIDNRSIFIARLPKGIIGKNTATLLGALLMTQFQQAALERKHPRKRVCPFISLLMNSKAF